MAELLLSTELKCYHCGNDCKDASIKVDSTIFCCNGCKTVYTLLLENDLCNYYDLSTNPGIKIKAPQKEKFAYLSNLEIADKLLDFNDGGIGRVTLYLPAIHCSSCIWLLENLHKLKEGVLSSRVNFTKKEITISFQKDTITLRELVEILDSFGYTPLISLESYNSSVVEKKDQGLVYKIGISAFCSGNIMLLSFPEYFGMDIIEDNAFKHLFSYLNLFFALPVVLYCAIDFFKSAYAGLSNKVLNLDVPISLGISAVFIRSVYEVLAGIGPGYFDSLTGLIFFLLIGKWLQNRTYKKFSFERDYHSYFPIAITKIEKEKEFPFPINNLVEKDEILVKNNEIIPVDSILTEGKALIDYSFVTGEYLPIAKKVGDFIYAGGKQTGNSVRLKVEKKFSHSYFLQLWSREVFAKTTDAYLSKFVLTFSKYFTYGTFLISFFTFLFWYFADSSKILFSVTSVLLVACPCALALSLPFALSNCMRFLGRNGLFMKSADAIEVVAEIDTIVFDKTGTLTESDFSEVNFMGETHTDKDLMYIRSAVRQSNHPLSQVLYSFINSETLHPDYFEEFPAEGILARFNGAEIKLGNAKFVGLEKQSEVNASSVYYSNNGEVKGYYKIQNKYREGVGELLTELGKNYTLHILSGDNDGERGRLIQYFPLNNMKFNQTPISKLEYIEALKKEGKKVLMLGDGLNDSGALKAADIGISVSDNVYSFSPSCDGIIEGKKLKQLSRFLSYSLAGVNIIKMSLVISLIYNAVGLFFAVQGILSPMIAAILMPVSSISVVVFVVVGTSISGRRLVKG